MSCSYSYDPTPGEGAHGERQDSGDPRGRTGGEEILDTPYVVLRLIGQGGMGEVYEAEHRRLGRRCVLKVLHRCHRGRLDLAARMRDEARSLAMLCHPNLVYVFDLGTTGDGRPFFAMELLRGRDLRAELSEVGVVGVPAALELVAQALDGLEAVHAAGIVHRDVKLENIFLCADGTVKLLDFGIAKVMGSTLGHTERGVAMGTPRSMAPEQCALGKIDPRADIYAIGLALFELIAGCGPFDELRGNPDAMRFAHCVREPLPPSQLAPQPIDAATDAAVLRAIAKAPADRFQSAREMSAALRALLNDRRRRRSLSADWACPAPADVQSARSPAAWTPSSHRALASWTPPVGPAPPFRVSFGQPPASRRSPLDRPSPANTSVFAGADPTQTKSIPPPHGRKKTKESPRSVLKQSPIPCNRGGRPKSAAHAERRQARAGVSAAEVSSSGLSAGDVAMPPYSRRVSSAPLGRMRVAVADEATETTPNVVNPSVAHANSALAALVFTIAVLFTMMIRDAAALTAAARRAAPRAEVDERESAQPLGPKPERSSAKGVPAGCKMTPDDAFFSRDDDGTSRRTP